MTDKGALLRLYCGADCRYIPSDRISDLILAPGEHLDHPPMDQRRPGYEGKDWFGCDWMISEDGESDAPSPGKFRLTDITKWQEEQVVPSAAFVESYDWEGWALPWKERIDPAHKLLVIGWPAGLFERLHHLMGFEEALMAFHLEPEAMHGLLDAIADYKLCAYKKVVETMHPDVILQMDDYGHNNGCFLSRDMWLTFIQPRLKRLIDGVHEMGCRFNLHCDGKITDILPDIAALGPDIINPAQPVNDLVLFKSLCGDMSIQGEVDDRVFSREESTDEQVVAAVQQTVSALAPGGNFTPMLPMVFLPAAPEWKRKRYALVAKTFENELRKQGYEILDAPVS